jgi:hypothetical protein
MPTDVPVFVRSLTPRVTVPDTGFTVFASLSMRSPPGASFNVPIIWMRFADSP